MQTKIIIKKKEDKERLKILTIKKKEKTKSKDILINITRIFDIKAKVDKLP